MDQAQTATPSKPFLDVGDLLRRSYDFYIQNIWTLLKLGLFGTSLIFGSMILVAIFLSFVSKEILEQNTILLAVLGLIYGVFITYIGFITYLSFYSVALKKETEPKKALKHAHQILLRYFWASLIMVGLILAGYFWLLVPGVILTVWFWFTPFIIFNEEHRGIDALLKSEAYVRGHTRDVFLILAAVWVISFVASLIPFIGAIFSLLFIPYKVIFGALLYQDLQTRTDIHFDPSRKKKRIYFYFLFSPLLLITVLVLLTAL